MSTWSNDLELENATSKAYDTSATYDSALYNYNGQLLTVWTNETKSS